MTIVANVELTFHNENDSETKMQFMQVWRFQTQQPNGCQKFDLKNLQSVAYTLVNVFIFK